MSDAPQTVSTEGYTRVQEADILMTGFPVYTNDSKYIAEVGPFQAINQLQLSIDRHMMNKDFSANYILYKFWVPPPAGSLKKKNTRVLLKAMIVKDLEDSPWILLTRPSKRRAGHA